jgi:hypothetical protein
VREAHFDLLAHRRPAARALGPEEDARLGQPPPERVASVGEIAEEPPCHASLLEVRLREEFFDEEFFDEEFFDEESTSAALAALNS